MKKIKRKSTACLLTEAISRNKPIVPDPRPNNYYKDLPPFMKSQGPAVPYIDGMYIKYCTKSRESFLFESKRPLNYPGARKFQYIRDALLSQFKELTIGFDVKVGGILTSEQIAPHVLIFAPDLFFANFIQGIKDFMHNVGYHYSCMQSYDVDGRVFLCAQFEPYCFKTDIFDVPEYIYHMTPRFNKKSILDDGIVVSWPTTPVFEYPKRVYCFTEGDRLRFKAFAQNSRQYQPNKNGIIEFTVFEIESRKTECMFFSDPNMPDAIYTYDDIPVSAFNRVIDDSVKSVI